MALPDLLSVALDPRMTPDAVRVALYYASLGPGRHAFNRDHLSGLLEEAGEKRIRKALQRAERCQYLTRHHGGQHTDAFEFSPAQEGGDNLSPALKEVESALSTPQAAGESCVVVDVKERTDLPPIVPLPLVHPDAEAAIQRYAAILTGCRDSLRDYLRHRVAPERQLGYVNTVAAIVNGVGFNWLGVAMERRPGLMAAALNELSGTDESKYASAPGNPRNLRQKLQAFVTDAVRAVTPLKATGTDGKPFRGKQEKAPLDQQEYKRKPRRGWNG